MDIYIVTDGHLYEGESQPRPFFTLEDAFIEVYDGQSPENFKVIEEDVQDYSTGLHKTYFIDIDPDTSEFWTIYHFKKDPP